MGIASGAIDGRLAMTTMQRAPDGTPDGTPSGSSNGAPGGTPDGAPDRTPSRLDRTLARLDRWFGRLFGLAHALACLAIAALAAMIVVQVAARALDAVLALLGLPITGFIVPSLAEIAGFLFVAGTFLALASTLREGVHIRVTLLIDHVPGGPGGVISRTLRTLAALLGAALFGYAAWHAWELTADSVRFGEVSYGILAIPLAIPQSAMTAGLLVFALAMVNEATQGWWGSSPDDPGAQPDDAGASPNDRTPTVSAGEPSPTGTHPTDASPTNTTTPTEPR